MNDVIRQGAALLTALVLAGAPAACGGGDEEPAPAPGGEATQAPNQPGEDAGAGSGAADGRGLFTSSCGSCHVLEAAGTSGTVGPNLDDLQPDKERVLSAIQAGPGVMPENLYQGAEAEAVAEFVAENAGA